MKYFALKLEVVRPSEYLLRTYPTIRRHGKESVDLIIHMQKMCLNIVLRSIIYRSAQISHVPPHYNTYPQGRCRILPITTVRC